MVTVTVSTGIAATATAESTAVTAITGRAGYNGYVAEDQKCTDGFHLEPRNK